MLEFDKEHLAIIGKLSKGEARAFVLFLQSEILRHQQDIDDAQRKVTMVKEYFGLEDV